MRDYKIVNKINDNTNNIAGTVKKCIRKMGNVGRKLRKRRKK